MSLQKFLKSNITISALIFLSLAIILNNCLRFFQNNSVYEFDPWLSNWQGGFVRRGIPGEFLFQIKEVFNLHLGWLTFIFICILYLIFYINFFQLIKKIKFNKLFIFIIFSPLGFYFPVLNSKASGQKEIIFLCLFSLFCYLIPKIKKIHAMYLMISIMIISGLSHEGLIFYFLYLMLPFFLFFDFKSSREIILNLLVLFLVSITLLLLMYYFHGTNEHVNAICNSIKNYANVRCKEVGQIAALGFIKDVYWNADFAKIIGRYKGTYGLSVFPKYFYIYGIGFVVGFLPLIFLYSKVKLLKNNIVSFKITPLLLFFAPLLATLPFYYLGFDWGRYLYISYICSMIFLFFCLSNNIFYFRQDFNKAKDKIFSKLIFGILIAIYCFGWTVPLCCELSFKPGIPKVFERINYYYNK